MLTLSWTMIEPDASVISLIRSLRSQGTTVALGTNQQSVRANFMANDLGYVDEFDHIICSCFVGSAKPDVEFFKRSVDILKVAPGHILFIDDHEANVEAAKSAGLCACRFHVDEGARVLQRLIDGYQ